MSWSDEQGRPKQEGRKRLTPWAKIAQAVEKGTGTRLSPEEVEDLGCDGALMTRGSMDLDAYRNGEDPYEVNE